MSGIDRTQEFAALAEQLSSSQRPASHRSSAPSTHPRSAVDGHFNSLAADIGLFLDYARSKLQELGKLVRQKGIFNDKTSEIQELSFDVKTAITSLNSKLETLTNLAESASASALNRHYHTHHTNVVETLKTRLLELTKDFKDTLQIRAETMKQQDSRRNMYSATSQAGKPTSATTQYTFNASSGPNYDVESGGQQEFQVLERGSAYHQSRAEAVESVQKMISELAQIFQKVAALVHQHDEMVLRIDENIDHSLSNVKEGQSELLKYYNTISSNRTLILKVFGIVMVFILFFVAFLA